MSSSRVRSGALAALAGAALLAGAAAGATTASAVATGYRHANAAEKRAIKAVSLRRADLGLYSIEDVRISRRGPRWATAAFIPRARRGDLAPSFNILVRTGTPAQPLWVPLQSGGAREALGCGLAPYSVIRSLGGHCRLRADRL